MTEGEKHCGLSSFLPMSCRGRAEAFARRLHNRLRSLGSHDAGDSSESTWLGEEVSAVTNLQPRPENGLFIDFELFDTPGSPAEIIEPELAKFITNSADDLEKCKRNSLDSDSSDGPYFDTENAVNNHQTYSEDEDSPEKNWCLNYEEDKIKNNNFYNAIDLESIKQNGTNETKSESYCSQINIQQDLTIECPNSPINPVVEVSTLEINDLDEIDSKESNLITDTNHLHPNIDDTELEERLPRVRRCSSLKTGKTPPGTPGRKKIVRFADVLGLDLADVRTFMDEIPKIPISAYEDLTLSNTSINSSALDSIHTSPKTVVPLFKQPGGEPDFMDKIRSNQVCLENAVLEDSVTLCISGTVRVRNLDFNKSVHIRYTLDTWKSFSDLQATYVDGSCDGFSDKFSFTLYVHTLNIGQRLELAVRFQCKGCQYWDSNGGKNYVFQCLPSSTNSSYVPVTTPGESNWAGAAFYYDNSVNLQTTVQEYVTRRIIAEKDAQMSGEMLTAVFILILACLFFYIQKIIHFTSPR